MALQPCTSEFRKIKRYFYRLTLEQVKDVIELHSLVDEELPTTGVKFTISQLERPPDVKVFQGDTEIPSGVALYEVTVTKRTITRRGGKSV